MAFVKWISVYEKLCERAVRSKETAYYLNLTLYTQKPVVITGAMRPATATSADGPFNLYQAVCLAVSDDAKDQGVMALFSSTIYAARDIQKEN